MPPVPHLVLFDGVCGLCHRFVQWMLRTDHHHRFVFASLQSAIARSTLERHGAVGDLTTPESVLVLQNHGTEHEQLLDRSRAVVFVFSELGGIWAILGMMLTGIPRPVADWGYDRIARIRYRIFGRLDRCSIPSLADRDRFIDSEPRHEAP